MMGVNMDGAKDHFIGFIAYNSYQESYEYIEDSCFIADSLETYQVFIENCWNPSEHYRPVSISFLDMLNDIGVSCFRFAIESEVLQRFKNAANIWPVEYELKPYYLSHEKDDNLFALRLNFGSIRKIMATHMNPNGWRNTLQ